MKEKVMNGLEKFSKAMLSPLSYISAAGLILVLGALLTSTSLSAMIPALQWTPIKLLGQLIYNCIMVIINNLSLMFCVGIAAALAKKNKQQAAIIGLMSYFMYLTAGNVTLTQLGMLAEADPMVGLYGTGQSTVFGIQTVDMGVFGGILLGLVCGWVYNRTCEKQFKGIITQIYSGNRWSFTCMVVFSILFGFGSCFFWPPVQNVISALTDLIATSGNFGLFLYGFLERFLIPTGLHHLIYTPFQFSALGNSLTVGDATYTGSYIVMMMEYSMGLPFSGGVLVIGFSYLFGVGRYNGAGMNVIIAAVEQGQALPWDFLCKIFLTALTLACGFKGGEVVPSFFVGATFGCVVGPLLDLPAEFAAAVGLVSIFCGATNVLIPSILLGFELFSGAGLELIALGCGICFMLSGHHGLYSSQTFVTNKLRSEYMSHKCRVKVKKEEA